MKKLLFMALGGLLFLSCKKNYTCECTTSTNNNGVVTTATSTSNTGKMKEDEARISCEAGSASTYINYGSYTLSTSASCKIK